MSAAGRWFVTPHAVRRYQERVERCSYDTALSALIRHSESAHRVKPWKGATLYRSGKPQRLRFIVREGGPDLPVLLTVYGGHDHR